MAPLTSRACLGSVAPAAQTLRAPHTPFLTSSRPHSPAPLQCRKQGGTGCRRRPGLTSPISTDELRPKGLCGSREVEVWLQLQITLGLYSHPGARGLLFNPIFISPSPNMCGSCFAASVKGAGSWGLALHLSVNTLETDGVQSSVIYSPSLRS